MAKRAKVARTVRFPFVMSHEERTKLDKLAKADLVSAATVLRVFIHREYERRHQEEPPHNTVRRNTGKRSPT